MSAHAPVTALRGIGGQFSVHVTKILECDWLGLKKDCTRDLYGLAVESLLILLLDNKDTYLLKSFFIISR